MTDLIRCEVSRGVATLTLDSPPNRNALSVALIEQLLAALDDAERDDAVRVIVLTHTGHVFSSGADLAETAAALETGRCPSAGWATSWPRSGSRRSRWSPGLAVRPEPGDSDSSPPPTSRSAHGTRRSRSPRSGSG